MQRIMSLTNNLEQNIEKQNLELENRELQLNQEINNNQSNFLENAFKAGIAFAINFGIKSVTPDIIEDQVIEIKDAIMEGGFDAGFETLVDKTKEFVNTISGIFTGNFNSIGEMSLASKSGGVIKSVSKGISAGIDLAVKKGKIDKTTARILKSMKTEMASEFSKNIENSMLKEIKKFEKLEKYIERYYKAWDDRDFEKMERNLKQINKLSKELVKFKEVIEKIDNINELHNGIVRTQNFDYLDGMEEAIKEEEMYRKQRDEQMLEELKNNIEDMKEKSSNNIELNNTEIDTEYLETLN